MAHLHRLIRLLTVTLITVISLPTYADEANDAYVLSVCRASFPSSEDIFWPSKVHCPAVPELPPIYRSYNYCHTPKSSVCDWHYVARLKTCPANQDLQQDGTCKPKTCPEGQELQPDGTCKPKENQCKRGEILSSGKYPLSENPDASSSTFFACSNGCQVQFSGTFPTHVGVIGGKTIYFGEGQYEYTGSTCAEGEGGAPSPSPDQQIPKDDPRFDCLKKGMSYGESNGKIICIPKDNKPGGNNGNQGGNQGGGNQGGGNQGGGNQGGGNQGGGGSSGGGGGSGDGGGGNGSGNGSGGGTGGGGGAGNKDKNEMEDFCAKHPDLSICKKSSYSGSGCDTEPKCDGDVIQCAQARELWKMQCALTPTDKKMVDLGNKLINGEDDFKSPADKANLSEIDIPSVLQSSETYAETCPPNLSISLMGQTVDYSFSNVCDSLRWVGRVGVALSLLTGAFIVVGAIRG